MFQSHLSPIHPSHSQLQPRSHPFNEVLNHILSPPTLSSVSILSDPHHPFHLDFTRATAPHFMVSISSEPHPPFPPEHQDQMPGPQHVSISSEPHPPFPLTITSL